MQPASCKCPVSFIPNILSHERTVWNLTLFPHCYFPSSRSMYSACVGFRSTLIIADDRRRHHRAERQRVEPTAELLRPRKQTPVMTGWKLFKKTVPCTSCGEGHAGPVPPYQCVGGLSSLQSDLQVRQGCVHLIHLLLAVIHVVVWRHDRQFVDVVLREKKERKFWLGFHKHLSYLVTSKSFCFHFGIHFIIFGERSEPFYNWMI